MRPNQRIRMLHIVDDLIFVRDRSVTVFGDEILDATVAAGRDDPLEGELEIVERVDGDDVATARRGWRAAARGVPEAPGFDRPAAFRELRLFDTAPSLRG